MEITPFFNAEMKDQIKHLSLLASRGVPLSFKKGDFLSQIRGLSAKHPDLAWIFIFPDQQSLQKTLQNLDLPRIPLYFPAWHHRWHDVQRCPDPMSPIRLETLRRSMQIPIEAQLWATTLEAVLQKLPPQKSFDELWQSWQVGDQLEPQNFVAFLMRLGYRSSRRWPLCSGDFQLLARELTIRLWNQELLYRICWKEGKITHLEIRSQEGRIESDQNVILTPTFKSELGGFLHPAWERCRQNIDLKNRQFLKVCHTIPNQNYWLPYLYNEPLSDFWSWLDGEKSITMGVGLNHAQIDGYRNDLERRCQLYFSTMPSFLQASFPQLPWKLWGSAETIKDRLMQSKVSDLKPHAANHVAQEIVPLKTETAYSNSAVELQSRSPSFILSQHHNFSFHDHVVHQTHGIARYHGLRSGLNHLTEESEFAELEYAEKARLYVPVYDFHLLHTYPTLGLTGEVALDKLGSKNWENRRKKAFVLAEDAAAKLLEAYAARQQQGGSESYTVDSEDLKRFCEGFPYQPTEDQHRAIEEVLKDLASLEPMDRLICGEVGFGKTEIALRASFVVARSNRQVMILVPTTLLALQHFELFKKRFQNWEIQIEMVCRFTSKAQRSQIRTGLMNGSVAIVIGTTQMLDPSFTFKRPGLCVIDEEHRFGVVQKEVIENLPAQIKRLSLTASPIPRTLSMALSGLKAISLMQSAPLKRQPVQTHIGPFDEKLMHNAIARELKRQGQVYYVNPMISTLEACRQKVQNHFPNARILLAHGQMATEALEQCMIDFYQARYDILVSSSIIETGLDNPRANTLLVDQVERFGLAQLHQLRGRVGRSDFQGYAYFFHDPERLLTERVQKRVEALERYQSFGAGYLLAEQDLALRGAGEFLGRAQSGKIHGVGTSYYHDMVRHAVERKRDQKCQSLCLQEEPLELEAFHVNGPQSLDPRYISDLQRRVGYYRALALAQCDEEFEALKEQMLRRHGPMSDSVAQYITWMKLRWRARCLGVRKLLYPFNKAKLYFHRSVLKSQKEKLCFSMEAHLNSGLLALNWSDDYLLNWVSKTTKLTDKLKWVELTLACLQSCIGPQQSTSM